MNYAVLIEKVPRPLADKQAEVLDLLWLPRSSVGASPDALASRG